MDKVYVAFNKHGVHLTNFYNVDLGKLWDEIIDAKANRELVDSNVIIEHLTLPVYNWIRRNLGMLDLNKGKGPRYP